MISNYFRIILQNSYLTLFHKAILTQNFFLRLDGDV